MTDDERSAAGRGIVRSVYSSSFSRQFYRFTSKALLHARLTYSPTIDTKFEVRIAAVNGYRFTDHRDPELRFLAGFLQVLDRTVNIYI